MNKIQDLEFAIIADKTLALIADIIEEIDQDCLIEVDFQGDILNLTTNSGIFVINKHSAAKEIWLSSPISGPYHFSYINGKWESKYAYCLDKILTDELKIDFSIIAKNH